jgi:nitric oxide reductase NorD protein
MLAANLVAALEEFGDRVAAYGFRSRGRHQVSFLRIKDFDGRFDQSARARLAALEPGGFTRIGAAIRHSVHLASTRAGTSSRLLVVISDGFPYDDDYQGAYAEHDTKQALTEAIDQAVGVVCLTVGTSTDDATLERMWGHVSHVDLVEPADLGRHLLPLFGSALKVANGRTRSSTRPGGEQMRARGSNATRVIQTAPDWRTKVAT